MPPTLSPIETLLLVTVAVKDGVVRLSGVSTKIPRATPLVLFSVTRLLSMRIFDEAVCPTVLLKKAMMALLVAVVECVMVFPEITAVIEEADVALPATCPTRITAPLMPVQLLFVTRRVKCEPAAFCRTKPSVPCVVRCSVQLFIVRSTVELPRELVCTACDLLSSNRQVWIETVTDADPSISICIPSPPSAALLLLTSVFEIVKALRLPL